VLFKLQPFLFLPANTCSSALKPRSPPPFSNIRRPALSPTASTTFFHFSVSPLPTSARKSAFHQSFGTRSIYPTFFDKPRLSALQASHSFRLHGAAALLVFSSGPFQGSIFSPLRSSSGLGGEHSSFTPLDARPRPLHETFPC